MEGPAQPAIASAPGEALFCPDCGYDLRGIASERCPECGLTIEREPLGESRVPWSHRRRIGRVRAYWRTVWLATFRTRRLGAEVARPVDYPDAQRFRLVTVLLATASCWGVLEALVADGGGRAEMARGVAAVTNPFTGSQFPPAALSLFLPWAAGALLVPVPPLAICLFLLMWTGVGSYWFHPRGLPVLRQNRAVALSYYASAPLAFLLPAALLLGVLYLMDALQLDREALLWGPFVLVGFLAFVSPPVAVVAQFVATLRLLRATTVAGAGRIWLAAVVIPVTWALSAAVTLVGLLWLVGYVRLVVDSLR